MSDLRKIIGICLIKNEDLYIKQVLKNILDFCDEIIVLDNLSTDNTIREIKSLNSEKIKIYFVESPMNTNKFIEKYYSTNTWMFGVDGDELYDPIGLKKFRNELLSGNWDDYWHLRGAQINIFELNNKTAKGHSNQFSGRNCGKLYNFKQIKKGQIAFHPSCERLHGLQNNALYSTKQTGVWNAPHLPKDFPFEKNNLRFLHLCFINRSSNNNEKNKKKYFIVDRPDNVSEKRKLEMYASGHIVEVNSEPFFS